MSRTRSIDFWADVKACLAKLDKWDALNQLILSIMLASYRQFQKSLDECQR